MHPAGAGGDLGNTLRRPNPRDFIPISLGLAHTIDTRDALAIKYLRSDCPGICMRERCFLVNTLFPEMTKHYITRLLRFNISCPANVD
jgi:hypothetical protein